METILRGPTGERVLLLVGLGSEKGLEHVRTLNQSTVGSHVPRRNWDPTSNPRNVILGIVQVTSLMVEKQFVCLFIFNVSMLVSFTFLCLNTRDVSFKIYFSNSVHRFCSAFYLIFKNC